MRISPIKAAHPRLELISDPDSFFGSVKEDFREYRESGFFQELDEAAIFIYRILGEDRNYTGLLARADIRDYQRGRIIAHEHTLSAKEQKQIQLLLKRKAAVKPVLLTYPRVEAISQWTENRIEGQAPFQEFSFEDESTTHQLWQVSETDQLNWLHKHFLQDVPQTFIADGHHRSSAVFHLHHKHPDRGQYDKLFAAFFPSDQLEIHDFNRVVELPDHFTGTYFMARLAELCDIRILDEPHKPIQKHDILMGLDGYWYMLNWKGEVLDQYADGPAILDAQLLNELVMRDLLGIANIRDEGSITYVEGPKGMAGIHKKHNRRDRAASFALYPVQIHELFGLCRAGRMLPPKSTWFEPRMKNGVIVDGFL